MARITWNDENLAKLAAMANGGNSHADIAEAFGVSKATIGRQLAKLPAGFDSAPASDEAPAPAPCAPAAPQDEAPAPASDEEPAKAPAKAAPAPKAPGSWANGFHGNRVDITVAAMRRAKGVTVVELAALFEQHCGGNGKLSTASQAIYEAPAARKLRPTNTGEQREGRAVYRIID